MRKTELNRTTTAVVIVLVCAAASFALLRAFIIHPPESMAREGIELFQSKGCVDCHYTDSRKTKLGPGLKGLFKRGGLPVSGRKVTEENVKRQLKTPHKNMPSFADRLTPEQREKLIEYLKTL